MKVTSREWWKSTILTALAGVFTLITTSLANGHFPEWPELRTALLAAAGVFITALIKYLTTDTVESAKSDIKSAIKPGQTVTVTKFSK